MTDDNRSRGLRLPFDSVAAAGILVRSGTVTIPLLVLYGLLAVPLGMPPARLLASGPAFIMAAMGIVGTGIILNETGRLLFIPARDGADDDIADCIGGMISQFCAVAVAIGGTLLGVMIATGHVAGA